MFLTNLRLRFWQACQNLSTKNWIVFCGQSLEKMRKNKFFPGKILKNFLWRRQMVFWQASRKFSGRRWIVFRSYSEGGEK